VEIGWIVMVAFLWRRDGGPLPFPEIARAVLNSQAQPPQQVFRGQSLPETRPGENLCPAQAAQIGAAGPAYGQMQPDGQPQPHRKLLPDVAARQPWDVLTVQKHVRPFRNRIVLSLGRLRPLVRYTSPITLP
jgi:hypothetical protein